ncbi:MAG: tetratricopeptide repeat protein [Sumerlaeia bacterium]
MLNNTRITLLSATLCVASLLAGCANQGSIEGINPTRGERVRDLSSNDSARLAIATAQELERVGSYAEAAVQYERAREYDPKQVQVSRNLAVLYDLTDRYSRSKDEYIKALQLFPRDAELLNDYGYFNYRRGNLELSEQYLTKATEIDPFLDRAWMNLGVTLAEQGRYKESLLAFEQVRPEPEALQNLGTIMARQGLFDEAKEALEEALRLDPNLEEARRVLGSIAEYEERLGS